MANKYVTVAGAGTKDGTSWANAFGLAEWKTDLEASASAGDFYYVEGGTYTLTSSINATLDGTRTNPITVIGVKAGTTAEPPTTADWANGDDRPLIVAAGYQFTFDNYWIFRNFRVTITESNGFRADTGSIRINCSSNNSSDLDRPAFFVQSQGQLIDSDGQAGGATKGRACDHRNFSSVRIIGCYLHDSGYGIYQTTAKRAVYLFNVIANIDNDGIRRNNGAGNQDANDSIINNTFYNCANGIYYDDSYGCNVMNNIIASCTTGINWGVENKSNIYDYNNFHDCTTDVTNVTKGPNATAFDPKFTNPSDGDFSLQPNSQCIGAGFSIELGVV